MKTILTIIALPITLIISIVCFVFVLLFESDFKTKEGRSAAERMQIESKTLLLYEAWSAAPIILKAIASLVVYYLMLF